MRRTAGGVFGIIKLGGGNEIEWLAEGGGMAAPLTPPGTGGTAMPSPPVTPCETSV